MLHTPADTNMRSDYDFSPPWHQAIPWTSADLLLNLHISNAFQWSIYWVFPTKLPSEECHTNSFEIYM